MNQQRSKLIYTLIYILICFLILFYLWGNKNNFSDLFAISNKFIILIFISQLGGIISESLLNFTVLRPFQPISFFNVFFSTSLARLLNYILPMKAGSVYQAMYLKKHHNLKLSNYAGTYYFIYMLNIFVSAIIGITGLILLYFKSKIFNYYFFIILALLLFTFFIWDSLVFLLKLISQKFNLPLINKIYRICLEIKYIYHQLLNNKMYFMKIIVYYLLNLSFLYLCLFLQLKGLNLNINLFSIAIYFSINILSLILNFTPGSIGIQESIQIIFKNLIGLSTNSLILVSLVNRLSLFAVLLILSLGLYLFHILAKLK